MVIGFDRLGSDIVNGFLFWMFCFVYTAPVRPNPQHNNFLTYEQCWLQITKFYSTPN